MEETAKDYDMHIMDTTLVHFRNSGRAVGRVRSNSNATPGLGRSHDAEVHVGAAQLRHGGVKEPTHESALRWFAPNLTGPL